MHRNTHTYTSTHRHAHAQKHTHLHEHTQCTHIKLKHRFIQMFTNTKLYTKWDEFPFVCARNRKRALFPNNVLEARQGRLYNTPAWSCTLMLYMGWMLFMQSTMTRRACFNPWKDPMQETVLPCKSNLGYCPVYTHTCIQSSLFMNVVTLVTARYRHNHLCWNICAHVYE
jgi:hypothetical protein